MPVDTSIYSQQQPVRFNTPFEVLGQIQHLQGQQQALQSNQALETERRQRIAEEQKKQAEVDNFNKIIGNPDLTPETFLETVRTQAPEHYLSVQKQLQDAAKSAADLQKIKADADEANAKVQTSSQEYAANLARMVKEHNYNPTAFELAMKLHEQAFPNSQTPAQLRQYVQQNGPDSIKTITDGLIRSSAPVSNAANATATTQAELPGKVAQSAITQQVATGTVGGLTPEQQVQQGQGAQRIGLEQQRLAIEKANQENAGAAPSLTPEGMQLVAHQFAMTGQMPPMGMSKQGAKVRTDIINQAADIYKGLDLPSQMAAYKANQDSLKVAQKQRDAVGGFEETALKNLDQFLGTAQKVVDTGSPLINKPLRSIEGSLLGSPEMAAYNAARRTVIPEFAKILSNPTLSGQLSDSARKEVEGLISGDATLKQAVAVANILKQDTQNRRTSLDDQIAAIQKRIATTPGGAAASQDNAVEEWVRDPQTGRLVKKGGR